MLDESGYPQDPMSDHLLIEMAKEGDGVPLWKAFHSFVLSKSVKFKCSLPEDEADSLAFYHFWRACLRFDVSKNVRLTTLAGHFIYKGFLDEYYRTYRVKERNDSLKDLDLPLFYTEDLDTRLECEDIDFSVLTSQERMVIQKYFLEEKNCPRIAKEVNLSKQRVHQIYQTALLKLKERYAV